jgi:hypothetical protein
LSNPIFDIAQYFSHILFEGRNRAGLSQRRSAFLNELIGPQSKKQESYGQKMPDFRGSSLVEE